MLWPVLLYRSLFSLSIHNLSVIVHKSCVCPYVMWVAHLQSYIQPRFTVVLQSPRCGMLKGARSGCSWSSVTSYRPRIFCRLLHSCFLIFHFVHGNPKASHIHTLLLKLSEAVISVGGHVLSIIVVIFRLGVAKCLIIKKHVKWRNHFVSSCT